MFETESHNNKFYVKHSSEGSTCLQTNRRNWSMQIPILFYKECSTTFTAKPNIVKILGAIQSSITIYNKSKPHRVMSRKSIHCELPSFTISPHLQLLGDPTSYQNQSLYAFVDTCSEGALHLSWVGICRESTGWCHSRNYKHEPKDDTQCHEGEVHENKRKSRGEDFVNEP
jgi:hypothetical protein